MPRAYAVYSADASRTWRACVATLGSMKKKSSMLVLAANLRALKDATPPAPSQERVAQAWNKHIAGKPLHSLPTP